MGRRQTLSKENIQIANKHMKICSTSLLEICKSKLQWGTTSHQSEWPSIKKSTNDKCWRGCAEKGTPLYWWECKFVQPLWRRVWRFLKKLKIELSYDSSIPLLGIYPEKTIIQRHMHPSVHCSTRNNSQDTETT